MTAVRPQIIKSYAQGDIDNMWKLVIQSSCFSFYLMWMICLPICLETDTILDLWLGDYPDHSVSFLRIILILCLIQTLKMPRTTILHAMAKVFFANITVGVVLCMVFPLAYIFLKMGGDPECVFWAANITMILSELVGVLVLRRYLIFSMMKYFARVHGRCLIVALVSAIIPFFVFDKIMEASLLRLFVSIMITTVSVGITSLFIGMDNSMRQKIYKIICSKIPNRK